VTREEANARFREWVAHLPELPDCPRCKRCVLAGVCCEDPFYRRARLSAWTVLDEERVGR
jgi:hypothetical protein